MAYNTISETYNLEELARTPVLLEIIIKTISEIRGKVAQLNAAKLYQIYTDFWLNREYDEKGDVRWLVTKEDKELFVLDLAWTMLMTDNPDPEIHYTQLSERVRDYFGLQMASRIEYFSSDIRFCSYLTHSEADGNYRFIHRSFMEYFCARRVYEALFEDQKVSPIVTERPILDEVFFFLCQMIGVDEIEVLWKLSRAEGDKTNKEFLIDLTARILKESVSIYEQKGAIKAAGEWADRLLQYSDDFQYPDGKIWGSIAKGNLKHQLGRYPEAQAFYEEALRISEEIGDISGLSQSLVQLGAICESRDEWDMALQYYQQALATFEEISDRSSVARTLHSVGTVLKSRGQLASALEYYQEALAISKETGDRASVGQTLASVGEVHKIRGEFSASLECLQKAVAVFREAGNRRSESQALSQLGHVHELTGRYDEADRIYRQTLAVAQDMGDRLGVSRSLHQIGAICTAVARFEEAKLHYQEALAISEELGDQAGRGRSLVGLGDVYRELQSYEQAASFYRQSIAVWDALGDAQGRGASLYKLAVAYAEQGALSDASRLFEKALDTFRGIDDIRSESVVARQLGRMCQQARDFERAEVLYRNALEINRELGDVPGTQDSLQYLGDLAVAQENFKKARSLYSSSLEMAQSIGDRRSECEISAKLGKLARKTGDKKRAIEYYRAYLEQAREMNLPVLEEVAQEYDLLRKEIANPYIVGMPIRDASLFVRRTELGELLGHVQRQVSVVLVGERRMGKTSLLMQLSQRLELPFVSVYVDLQRFFGQAEALLNGLIRLIVEELTACGLLRPERWERYSLTYASDFVSALESMLDEAREGLEDIKLVLLLDEGDLLLRFGSQFATVLRSALVANQDVVAVIAGTSRILGMPETPLVSPMLNLMARVDLGPLTNEDTQDLIEGPSMYAGLAFEPRALERIYELTGGVPFYVQVIGSLLFELARLELKRRIDASDVNEVVHELLVQIEGHLAYSLNQLDDEQRSILAKIAQDQPLRETRKQAIQDLKNKHLIVEENGSYRFVSELFELWILRRGIGG